MSSAALDLQKALILRLSGDAALTGQLGGNKIYDHPSASSKLPYVSLGQTMAYDWSTASEAGHEHLVTIHVWSRAGGRIEAHEILEKIRLRLDGFGAEILNHRLVLMRLEFEEVRFDVGEDGYHGMMRYRALTEVL
jgi:Protein of unknown function (DUF3168)